MTEQNENNGAEFELEPLGKEPPATTGPRMLIPLFVIPMVIVGVVVGLFFGVSALVGSEATPSELISRVETGGYNDRWQAAASLADIAVRKPEDLESPEMRQRIHRAFELAGQENPDLRQYLARVIGTLGDQSAVPLLEGAIQDHLRRRKENGGVFEGDPEKIGSEFIDLILNLGRLKNPSSAATLLPLASDPDKGIRTVVSLALGDVFVESPPENVPGEVADALIALHQDEDAWVRMNAALSLAKIGRAEGAATLEFMLQRKNLESQGLQFPDGGAYTVGGHDPAYRPIAFALVSLRRLAELSPQFGRKDPVLLGTLEQVAAEEPNQELRQGAQDLLDYLQGVSAN